MNKAKLSKTQAATVAMLEDGWQVVEYGRGKGRLQLVKSGHTAPLRRATFEALERLQLISRVGLTTGFGGSQTTYALPAELMQAKKTLHEAQKLYMDCDFTDGGWDEYDATVELYAGMVGIALAEAYEVVERGPVV